MASLFTTPEEKREMPWACKFHARGLSSKEEMCLRWSLPILAGIVLYPLGSAQILEIGPMLENCNKEVVVQKVHDGNGLRMEEGGNVVWQTKAATAVDEAIKY